jgi:DcuC family C4-dicarboxylate transporter
MLASIGYNIDIKIIAKLDALGTTSDIKFPIKKGYSGYMNAIGANQMAVNFLVKPLMKIKRKSLFVPVVFLIGNLMSKS